MPIVLISDMPHGLGDQLARNLKDKTEWPLLSRENLVERARDQGIKLGRLETSIIKSPVIHERLAREKEIYLAFATAALCESVENGNLIYHGRAGHLLLPGVTHRLRVGVIAPRDLRVENVMTDLNLPRDKALLYLEQLDEDIAKWVRFVHRQESPKDPGQYDIFINLQVMSLPNASALLCEMATLPDFRPTPTSMKRMEDLRLTAQAKLRLAFDQRTRNVDLGVKAVDGVVTVIYMPRQQIAPEAITEVLRDLEGCRENLCTMAETNILWVQENFDPDAGSFGQIIQLAQRWGAAVELIRLVPPEDPSYGIHTGSIGEHLKQGGQLASGESITEGVEEDEPMPPADDGGLSRTIEELIANGRSAGGHTVYGGQTEILEMIKSDGKYSLVVIGDLFLSKGHEARKRETRELALLIHERIKAPVITVDEFESRFLFGKKQAIKLVTVAALVICIYSIVFSFQGPILNFLGGEIHDKWKWMASIGVALFVPFVAYSYSTVTGLILKLIGID